MESSTPEGDLPEAYGTGQMLVTARDPHWLYVHWDLTDAQMRECNARSMHGHPVLRITRDGAENEAAREIHVHPESRHWFVHVAQAGMKYAVELGYYGVEEGWTRVSISAPTPTPPDGISPETGARFATIPSDVPLSHESPFAVPASASIPGNRQERLPMALHPHVRHTAGEATAPVWTPAQEEALAEFIRITLAEPPAPSSGEAAGMIRRRPEGAYFSLIPALGAV